MKFSIALFAILSAAPTVVQAGIPTCSDQKDCLGFTITKVDPDACSSTSAACEFNICMTLQFGGSCDKGTSETVSHTCEKASNVCQVGGADGGSFESAAETKSLPNGYSACQAVSPGGFAEFLVKDANGNCGTADLAIAGGTITGTANCQKLETMTNFDSCTGNVDKECVWTIQAPECGTTTDDSDSDNRVGTSGSDTTTEEENAYLCA